MNSYLLSSILLFIQGACCSAVIVYPEGDKLCKAFQQTNFFRGNTAVRGWQCNSSGHANSNPCSGQVWTGVTCENTVNVSKINLPDFQISGQLGSSIWDLNKLVSLNLSNNNFMSTIPPMTSSRNRQTLRSIDLSNSNFNDVLPPSLSGAKNLTFLDLSGNNLEGGIKGVLLSLSQLTYLDLRMNYFNGNLTAIRY